MTASENSQEEWRPVVGYEGHYEVSSIGRVRSIKFLLRDRIKRLRKTPTILAPATGGKKRPYWHVCLCTNAKRKNHWVHHLVLEAFAGQCPPGCEAAHENGNGLDNRRTNLSWMPHHENMKQMIAHGNSTRGEKHPMARLTENQVREILALDKRLELHEKIASTYGVSRRTVTAIAQRKIWRHV